MGKKGGRQNNTKPRNAVEVNKKKLPEELPDNNFIVFVDPKKDSNPRKQVAAAGSANQDTHIIHGDAPKRPDVKKLIGGNSWTGKLPVNILSEHCQKQRWEKPEYTMSKVSEGYSSMVILKARNPKTKELEVLPPFKLPTTHKHLAIKPSALEARHFAATYGLFRVCSMRNIHMMLPPNFRDLWKGEFGSLKNEDIKQGRSWMYEADPFAVMREHIEAKVAVDPKRSDLEKSKVNAHFSRGTTDASPRSLNSDAIAHHVPRVWVEAPKIEMGKKTRSKIEDLVRKYTTWNPNGKKLSKSQQNLTIDEFKKLGFRQSHIEEAISECKDREESLEWLLIHIPEDDLPAWALPEGYLAGVSMASSDLKKECAIKRLAEPGYSIDLCKQIFGKMTDEALAAELLQKILISNNYESTDAKPNFTEEKKLSSQAIWEEEISSLHAVLGNRFKKLGKDLCEIQLSPEPEKNITAMKVIMRLRKSQNYPFHAPIISICADLPAYIRLSITKQTLIYLTENLLGEQMLYFSIDWVEQNLHRIVEKPGKLRDISTVTSATDGAPPMKLRRQQLPKYTLTPDPTPNDKSRDDWVRRQSHPKYKSQIEKRRTLPAWELRQTIIDSISLHQVTIISGETGSGKSTQCAQFILDDRYEKNLGECTQIICTQPRRISAISLADRVSEERCSAVGQEVGYIIRGESKISQKTKIKFVTTGVLLRKLQNSGGSLDDVVASTVDISHIIIDEVHERSLDTDFLLVLLRDMMRKRKDLKLILMSATLDAGIFEKYFQKLGKVGKIEISGRTYPVEDYYLDDIIRLMRPEIGTEIKDEEKKQEKSDELDLNIGGIISDLPMRINYDLITELVKEIDAELSCLKQNYGILIFVPGVSEINKVLDYLRHIPNLHALPLHASLQSIEQRKVFPHAPPGKRKVIVSTNIAETSITIDDIVAVIDTGRVKETSYDAKNQVQRLQEIWASRAACKQRRGRAGRVRAGKCYKIYTRNVEMNKMPERPEPEIKRVPLEQLCLSVRAMGIQEVNKFLANALTPPENSAIDGAIKILRRIGALDGDELTALGLHLSMIPADLRCGKLMVYGAMFGCLDACVTIAAILTTKSPFISPFHEKNEMGLARVKFAQNHGDLIGDLRAFDEWTKMINDRSIRQQEIQKWCFENFLSFQNLNDISSNKLQLLTSLSELSFIPSSSNGKEAMSYLNRHNSNISLIRSLCAGAFNPQVARISFPEQKFAPSYSGTVALDHEAKTIKYFNEENGRVFIHPSSTLFRAQSFPGHSNYIAYFRKLATSKIFIRDLTPFNAYSALLFSGPITLSTTKLSQGGRGIIVDGWLYLRGWARIGVLISRLRRILDDFLARKIDQPELFSSFSSPDNSSSSDVNEVIDVVIKLVEFNGLDQ
ncbi:putative p-loop containing nucleoside triphosphate hydrolase [Erysiphe necator]|uniref:Putative p-loop containing nucleoside triphosphate hydrolase n=1 Tax=Uncinula necator TaxID=52586 RepID=A0A0B1P0F7_UNCNE|nr:putative p-loop containing nucleoside triphosphate hydrolase [Erysiphe necator]